MTHTQPLVAESWRPSASLAMLRARAELLARLRAFFHQRGVMEVETPLLSAHANPDPAIDSMALFHAGRRHWLHSSPEFAMKRLLAAGSGPIYQICKVFRAGESGRLHNPEFSLLEWYRPGLDHLQLMDEVAELIAFVSGQQWPLERIGYAELFARHLAMDPHSASTEQLQRLAEQQGLDVRASDGLERDAWLDLLMSHLIEPRLGQDRLSFVYAYPASQAALARLEQGPSGPQACRFELYLQGIELANGFYELSDGVEQRRRFEQDNARRRQRGQEPMPLDPHLLAALEQGLPDCAGVALGLDRLLLLLQGGDCLQQVLAFPFDRA
ncbi:EF-P lysine aminoacylase EpmA [Magnetovirga frankeli]|uniref:EF-P lysine aminoacylase EpmA n=1 Tax=Magnetovirga frankeli TaxID=947516 RepID=UPI003D347044